MNIFQKQLMIGDKSLAELPDLDGKRYARKITPPARVSVEEFEATQCATDDDKWCKCKLTLSYGGVCIRCGREVASLPINR